MVCKLQSNFCVKASLTSLHSLGGKRSPCMLQFLGHEYPADTFPFRAYFTKARPSIFFIKAGRLEADGVEHRRTAAALACLFFEGVKNLRSQSGTTQGSRQVKQIQKRQPERSPANSSPQHFIGDGIPQDHAQRPSVTAARYLFIELVQTFAYDSFKLGFSTVTDKNYALRQRSPFFCAGFAAMAASGG